MIEILKRGGCRRGGGPLMWLLIVSLLGALASGESDFKYQRCKLLIDDRGEVMRDNSAPTIHVRLTCKKGSEDVLLIDETSSVANLDPRKFEAPGTPLTFFDDLTEFSSIARIIDYMEAEPFVLYDSEFISVPRLSEGPPSVAPLTIQSSRVLLDNCTFIDNSQRDAGAIYLDQGKRPEFGFESGHKGKAATSSPSLVVQNSLFKTGKGFAGVIMSVGYPHVHLTKSKFIANTGYGIKQQQGGSLIIDDCEFDGEEGPNLARPHEAAVIQGTDKSTVHLLRSMFKNHYAREGSVIQWTTKAGLVGPNIILEDSVFLANGGVAGGVLSSRGGINVEILNSNITSNLAHMKGGALSFTLTPADQLNLTVVDSVFKENTGTFTGGAIDFAIRPSYALVSKAPAGIVNLLNADFLSNIVMSGEGGAINFKSMEYLELNIQGGLFRNNSANSKGGALNLEQLTSVDINGVTFEENYLAEEAPIGGAINAENVDNVMVKKSHFKGNKAGDHACQEMPAGLKGGGALAVSSMSTFGYGPVREKSLSILDTVFEDSSAQVTGGAILVDKYDRLEMSGVSILNSKAYSAGAVNVDSVKVTSIDRSTVNDNEACGWDGGAFFFMDTKTVDITKSTFMRNSASNMGGDAGAVKVKGATDVFVEGTKFVNNSANGKVGGLYLKAHKSMKVLNCHFAENNGRYGGALRMLGLSFGSSEKAEIGGSSFFGNVAKESVGGAVDAGDFSSLHLFDSDFDSNSAVTTGGSVYLVKPGDLRLRNVSFASSTAGDSGAGMHVTSAGDVSMENIKVSDNTAGGDGAGLYFAEIGEFEVVGGVVERNAADGESAMGGGLFLDGANGVQLSGVEFDQNEAEGEGGAARIHGVHNVSIIATKASNSKSLKGGAFCIHNVTASVKLSEVDFSDNSAEQSGGTVFLAGAPSLTTEHTTVKGSQAQEGGAFFVDGVPVVDIADAAFETTTAEGNGGALSLAGGKNLTVSGASIASTKAAKGGLIHSEGLDVFTATDVTINGAEVSASGGVIDLQKAGKITMKKWNVAQAKAGTNGGALSMVDVGVVSIKDFKIDGSEADQSGGAIYASGIGKFDVASIHTVNTKAGSGMGGSLALRNLNVSISSSSVSGSSAHGNGGCIAVEDTPRFTMITSTLDDCTSISGDGGALHLPEIKGVRIESTRFSKSKAKAGKGGGVYVVKSGGVDLKGITFESCSAQKGGGAYVHGIKGLPLHDIVLKECIAEEGGGLLLEAVAEGGVTVTKSTVENNRAAKGKGGGMVIGTTGAVKIENSKFRSNTAGGSGGSVFINTTEQVAISGLTFENSAARGGDGGALYLESAASVAIHKVAITASSDHAANNGGGFCLRNVGAVAVDDFDVKSTKVSEGGGALYINDAASASVSNVRVEHATARNGAGLFFSGSGDISVDGLTAAEVTAAAHGGAVYVHNCANTTLAAVEVSDANAVNGGGVFVSDVGNVSGDKLTFRNVEAQADGGAAYVLLAENTRLTGVAVTKSRAVNGAGVFVEEVDSFTGAEMTFTDGVSVERGGGLYVKATGSLHLAQTAFVGGKAAEGAGLWMEKVEATKFGRVFENRGALLRRLLAAAAGGEVSVVVDGATFSGNAASGDGGAVFATDLDGATFSDLTVDSNHADGGGGAMFVSDTNSLALEDSTFAGNNANDNGGAVATNDVDTVQVTGSQFTRSSGDSGGAIFISNADSVSLAQSEVSQSEANQDGGGLMLDHVAVLDATNLTFKENKAQAGGAVGIEGDGDVDVQMTAVRFEGNRAETWEGSNLQVSSCDASVQVAKSRIGVPFKKAISVTNSEQSLHEAMHQDPNCPGKVIHMNDCVYMYKSVGMDTMGITLFVVLVALAIIMVAMVFAVWRAHNPVEKLLASRRAERRRARQEAEGEEGIPDDSPEIPFLTQRSMEDFEEGIGWSTTRENAGSS